MNYFSDTLSDGSSVNSYNLSGLPNQDDVDGLAAVYQLRDIDSFIAKITVPPPPETQWNQNTEALDDISAFIIPPPPLANDHSVEGVAINNTIPTEVHTKHTIAKELPPVMNHASSSRLNGGEKISPKIASIQQKFLSGSSSSGSNGASSTSNGGNSTDEQPSSFKGFQDTLTRKKSPSTSSAPNGSMMVRQNSDLGLPPPPPPPRSSIPKGMLKKSTYEFGGGHQQQQQQPPPARPSKLPLKPQNSSEENR